MSRGGFYLMARGWMDHPALATKEPFTKREAWVWLIENTAYRDMRLDVLGKTVVIRRGQLCRSFRDLASEWGWSLGATQRFIARLQTDTLLSTESDTGRLTLTICNYEKYQSPRAQADTVPDTFSDTPPIHEQYAGDTQKKEGKEKKELPGSLRSPAGGPPPGRGRKPKPKQPDLGLGGDAPVADATSAPPVNAATKAVWADGLPKLSAMAGGCCRSLLGRWLSDGHDPKRIYALILEAHRRFTTPGEALDDAKSWIIDRLVPKAPESQSGTDEVGGWSVAEVTTYCRRVARVPEYHWPGLEKVVKRAIAAGAHPFDDLEPVMRDTLRRNPNEIGLGLITNAIKDRLDAKAAAAARRAAA